MIQKKQWNGAWSCNDRCPWPGDFHLKDCRFKSKSREETAQMLERIGREREEEEIKERGEKND